MFKGAHRFAFVYFGLEYSNYKRSGKVMCERAVVTMQGPIEPSPLAPPSWFTGRHFCGLRENPHPLTPSPFHGRGGTNKVFEGTCFCSFKKCRLLNPHGEGTKKVITYCATTNIISL